MAAASGWGGGRAAVFFSVLINLITHHSLLILIRRIHTAWFQYLITLAPYCFEWWERLIVHALVAGGIAAAFYFAALVVRGAGLLWAARG